MNKKSTNNNCSYGGKCIPAKMKECVGCRSYVEICKEKAITVKNLEKEMSEIASSYLRTIFD